MKAASAPATLSREVIVKQALTIADHDGLAAVSMRRVGAELGHSGMALYGYVASKDELLQLMVDQVFGEIAPLDDTQDWRHAIIEFFVRVRSALLTHAAVARLAAERPVEGGHSARHSRLILATLRGAGLTDDLAGEAFIALSCYTLGASLYTAGRDGTGTGTRATTSPPASVRASSAQFRGGLEHLIDGYAAHLTTG
ncbi:MAG TPA: TetR/AcrR family transcriptional regulator [Pseudonocardia sp.]|nr:TetR/AcrR family transcriptional regulator [Pseudonocardia sp.]